MPGGRHGLRSLLGGSGPSFWGELLISSSSLPGPHCPHSLCLFSSHADIPGTCVHYTGGLLDALIQGLKEVRALVQSWGQGQGRLGE